ncbi:riboflavin synthase [Desulfocurvibacter africanus]|uniref:Riboflavin synthase n=1 Tax=Desulfocurvibacter africanus subsp. africanus str. Walvis Bay TaxID=690850 RepID=F3YXW5_DESAF|nr:riboflavin synthase [Desulfocurvibacter africanus]EGJ50667.1 riboflavin synthase, alpha subunit [Desulfocurvibacter africanus subsp. africanus str. Walvis Bay]
MFTGLIQGLGRIEAVENRGAESRLRVAPRFALTDVRIGESIAVNGACLTVETWNGSAFTAYASAETMRRTNLGKLRPGSNVNLERALAFGDRLGGHLVSGHVDCLAEVESVSPAGESKKYVLRFPAEYGPTVIEKGSVALDGISLTINECGPDFLSVNIIPETQGQTTILDWAPGRAVNMETDLIGKYVQRMIAPYVSGQGQGAAKPSSMNEEFLRRHGF